MVKILQKKLEFENILIAERFFYLKASWTSSRTKTETVPIRMNGKHLPNSYEKHHVSYLHDKRTQCLT